MLRRSRRWRVTYRIGTVPHFGVVLGAKCWLKGGVDGQFPRNVYDPTQLVIV